MASKIIVKYSDYLLHKPTHTGNTLIAVNTLNYVYYTYLQQIGVTPYRVLKLNKHNCITETPTAASRDSKRNYHLSMEITRSKT